MPVAHLVPVTLADIPMRFQRLDHPPAVSTSIVDILRIIRRHVNQWHIKLCNHKIDDYRFTIQRFCHPSTVIERTIRQAELALTRLRQVGNRRCRKFPKFITVSGKGFFCLRYRLWGRDLRQTSSRRDRDPQFSPT